MSSSEIENIRRNLLHELTEIIQRLKRELLTTKQAVLADTMAPQRNHDGKSPNYKGVHMSEEFFLNDINQKLGELEQIIQMAVEIGHLTARLTSDNPRERTPNGRQASTGRSLHIEAS
jgi:hypothetical protein